ncbi:E3 ubiquitin-protein ligase TRAIP-like isoform X2 [Odontomachus brunneus]|uniref:E3 ubiquitin-protein ligase TRAIP-like isoform X2 n=1 Tax=Odontomachus brunneus TaxID=486640 RepID=UPI0013F1A151|nr:E3 ubiquitin-protein ligase TRAIP-like isoform X2 [Odontomachus brunneus]
MNIVCTICRDNFIQSDDISVTRCGHIFHLNCLSRWLTRSNSCPECRKKTSQEKIQRLYVTFATNETNSTDSLSMQERIDSLKFQVLLNEKNIKYYTSKNETLEKQNAGLRQEVRKVESEMNKKNSKIYLLKEQIRDLKEKYTERESLKHKLSQKEKELENLQYLKKLLYGSVMEAEELIERTDRDTLVTYIKVMKRDMSRNVKRWESLYKHIKNCITTLMEVDTLEDQFKKSETTFDKSPDNAKILLRQMNEIKYLIMVSLEACQHFGIKSSISNSPKKLSENSLSDVEEVKMVSNKTCTKQETGSLDISLSVETEEAVSSMTNTRQEILDNSWLDILSKNQNKSQDRNQDKCPISKKRAKLSLLEKLISE